MFPICSDALRALGAALLVALSVPAEGQFRDDFDDLKLDPSGRKGWRFRTGDGDATMDLRQGGDGYASIFVDATADRRNEWWALIQREVATLDLALLARPEYEVRIGARIRLSHAPRRVNLQVQTQRTTDYHSHLMEFDIAAANEWHTISYTTRGFDARPGDTLIAHMALMDWGLSKYRADVDFVTLDLVHASNAPPDQGVAVPYHPPVADPAAFAHAIETRTGGVLRWDLTAFRGKRVAGSGLLEVTTRAVEGTGLLRVVEIVDGEFNPQPIIDWPPARERGGRTLLTISQPVLQRLIDGRTEGMAIGTLGDLKVSFEGVALLRFSTADGAARGCIPRRPDAATNRIGT